MSGQVPQLASAPARLMPPPGFPLRGRDREVLAVREGFAAGRRLVTLVGPGGIGKTRIALEVAAGMDRDGVPVTTVALDALDGGGAVAAVRDLETASRVAPAPPLIVLDTFEHVREAAATLDALLRRSPARVLVTSRARLHLDHEQVVVVGALDPASARRLFVGRARAAGVDDDELGDEVVERICAAADHLPLAVELAAVRAGSIGVAAVGEQLSSGAPGAYLAALGGSAARGRSGCVAGNVAWAEQLLSPAAARLLRRLAVVTGALTPEVVTALGPDRVSGPSLLNELADLHLVQRVPEADLGLPEPPGARASEPVFRLPRAVAEHGRDAMVGTAEDGAALVAYLAHARRVADEVGAGLEGPDDVVCHRRARRERDALRALLRSLAERRDRAGGLEVAVGLAPHWLQAGPLDEGQRWLDTFLTLPGDAHPATVDAARAWAAALAVEVGRHDRLGAQEGAVAALRGRADTRTLLLHLDLLAQSRLLAGDLAGASTLAEECLALASGSGSATAVARSLNRRANIARQRGEDRRAAELALDLLEQAEEHGRPAWAAWAHTALAHLRSRTRPLDVAVASLRESRESSLAAGLLRPATWTTIIAGGMLSLGPDVDGALLEFRQGVRMAQDLGHHSAAVCATMGIAGLGTAVGLHGPAAMLHRALEHHVDPLHGGVVPPLLDDAYIGSRSRSYAVVGARTDDAHELRPWPEVVRLASDLADAVAQARRPVVATTAHPRTGARRTELSDRELEVLAELAEGGTNREIALRLFISPKTVMHHTSAIYRKLQVGGRAEAVARAFQMGILSPR